MRRCLLVLASIAIGCSSVETPGSNHNPSGFWASDLVLEATAEPPVLERGGTLTIRFAVTNDGEESVVRGFSSGCIYGFGLWHRGEMVSPPPPVCTANAPIVRWAPGEVVTVQFQWTWDDPGIEPGVYRVIAGFGPRGEGPAASPIEIRLQ